MLKKEYTYDQTEFLSKLLQTILFPKSSKNFNINQYNFEGNFLELQNRIIELMESNKYNDAENLLFYALDSDQGEESLQVAVWFYAKMNKIDEKVLEENNFSHEEVLEGLQEIEKRIVIK